MHKAERIHAAIIHCLAMLMSVLAPLAIIAILIGLGVSFYNKALSGDIAALPSTEIGELAALLISTTALSIAFFTFQSIDRVNQISSMEGSVLDDEHYSIAYYRAISRYAQSTSKEEFAEKVYRTIRGRTNHAKSLVVLSDKIQTFIDNLIWLAYLDNATQSHARILCQLDKYLKKLNRSSQKFIKLNSGVRYLLEENLALIGCVLAYQQGKDSYRTSTGETQSIVDVRGEMLRNPISRIVYHDYLGLHYLRKSQRLILIAADKENGSLFSTQGVDIDAIKEAYSSGLLELETLRVYLKLSKEAFFRAQKLAEKSLLWNGYIRYNQCRVSFLELFVFEPNNKEKTLELSKAIDEMNMARHEIRLLISNVICAPKSTHSFLVKCFEEELQRAENLRGIFAERTGVPSHSAPITQKASS